MNLSLLVHSFNEYQFLWSGSLNAWRSCYTETCNFYWGTDTEDHEKHDFCKFEVIYSGKGSWSDRLTRLLQKIPTKYVLYAQEDHWPTGNVPYFDEMLKIVEENQLLRLQISPINRFYTLSGSKLPLFFDQKSKYLVSHQPSIWDKNFFLEQIKYNEDPWLNEYEGTKRLNTDPKIIDKIAIYPCDWYKHTCIRGKMIES